MHIYFFIYDMLVLIFFLFFLTFDKQEAQEGDENGEDSEDKEDQNRGWGCKTKGKENEGGHGVLPSVILAKFYKLIDNPWNTDAWYFITCN